MDCVRKIGKAPVGGPRDNLRKTGLTLMTRLASKRAGKTVSAAIMAVRNAGSAGDARPVTGADGISGVRDLVSAWDMTKATDGTSPAAAS